MSPKMIIPAGNAAVMPSAFADEVTVKTATKHHDVHYGDHEIYFAPETIKTNANSG